MRTEQIRFVGWGPLGMEPPGSGLAAGEHGGSGVCLGGRFLFTAFHGWRSWGKWGEKFRPGNSNCLRTASHGPVEIVDLNMVIFHSYVIVDFPIKNGDFPLVM